MNIRLNIKKLKCTSDGNLNMKFLETVMNQY